MNKQELKILEAVYEKEIEAAISKGIHLFQTKSKVAEKLVVDGMLEKRKLRAGGFPPLIIEGYELTHAGRFTYCDSCSD